MKQLNVTVIAPGGGTGINNAVYCDLNANPQFNVDIVGRSRAEYDCYPEEWSHGAPAPNLRSFAHEVLLQGLLRSSDLLVVGSRGGQVVLPHFWATGSEVPPTMVINGGCAMNLPSPVRWPDSAVTFLLLGGQDNFRGDFTHAEYISDAKSRVPPRNGSTAILYVNEMEHMPQAPLLAAILPLMLIALQRWKAHGTPPLEELRPILAVLNKDGWSGRLLFTRAPGKWEDIAFSPCEVARLKGSRTQCRPQPVEQQHQTIELTKADELKALMRAAAKASMPGGGAPAHGQGDHFAAVVQAASLQSRSACSPERPRPILPVPRAGHGDPKALRGGISARSPRHCADPSPAARALGLHRGSPWGTPMSDASPRFYTPVAAG